jgi:hypothetical protein
MITAKQIINIISTWVPITGNCYIDEVIFFLIDNCAYLISFGIVGWVANIDTKSSFADWLNNQIVRDQLKFDIKVCLIKNGYPPQYSPEVFRKVMEQVENFEENN